MALAIVAAHIIYPRTSITFLVRSGGLVTLSEQSNGRRSWHENIEKLLILQGFDARKFFAAH